MRPRPLGLGNGLKSPKGQALQNASMRPRPLGLGNVRLLEVPGVDQKASMRPRPLGLGNDPKAKAVLTLVASFNEAEAVGPRKCWSITAQRSGISLASMRPRPLGLGNVPKNQEHARAREASMRPRPLGLGNENTGCGLKCPTTASMRPRPLGLGNVVSRAIARRWKNGFNEAEAVGPRK